MNKGDKQTMAIYTLVCCIFAAIVIIPNAKEHLGAVLQFVALGILPWYSIVWMIVLFVKPEKQS
jgi:hypothetical protein